MKSKNRRVSVSLPPDVDEGLSEIASFLHITKSALLTGLLRDALPPLQDLIRALPSDALENGVSELDVVRLRGKSVQLVNERLEALNSMASDLLAGVRPLDKTGDG